MPLRTVNLEHLGGFMSKDSASVQHTRRESLAFLAALLVFLTFIVKDGLRERLKEDTDSLNTLEAVTIIRSGNIALAQQLSELRAAQTFDSQVQMASDRMQSAVAMKSRSLGIQAQKELHATLPAFFLRQFDDFYTTATNALDTIAEVRERLPFNPDVDEKLTQLSRSLHDLEKKRTTLVTSNGAVDKDTLIQMGSVATDAQLLNRLILAEIRGVRHFMDKEYRVITWLSYGLYTIGFLLALLSRHTSPDN